MGKRTLDIISLVLTLIVVGLLLVVGGTINLIGAVVFAAIAAFKGFLVYKEKHTGSWFGSYLDIFLSTVLVIVLILRIMGH